jgi:anti-anti-sigma factor
MFESRITKENDMTCIVAEGRIDALSSAIIKRIFDDLILAGERILLVDMTSVHYVSSAGLRIFISAQKELKKVGGEIIFFGFTDPVFEVFKMSGFTKLFRIVTDKADIPALLEKETDAVEAKICEMDGMTLQYIEREAALGSLFTVGSQDRTGDSSYTQHDVVAVKPADMTFGCGLAALGDSYDEYSHLFGESMVINNTFFFYPALKRSSVDFLINADQNPGMTYKFLHGFGFNGDYRYLLSFQGTHEPVTLPALLAGFFSISRANVLGVTLLAESKGFWGMHIKRVPLAGQKPANGKSIFDSVNFTDWFDFPVEPSHVNNIVAATGIAVREGTKLSPDKAFLVSGENSFHIHGGVFDKAPLGNNIAAFDKELMRIFNDYQAHKIQHILGQSRFSGGMAAIVEIGD